MKTRLLLILLLVALVSSLSVSVFAQEDSKAREEALKLVKSLKYKQGEIDLRGGLAKLKVPKEFNYIGPDDADKVLVKLWGNPPGEKTLGLLMPADKTPLDMDCWVVTLSYVEDGYVKDNDANKINYDDLLKKMQKQAK